MRLLECIAFAQLKWDEITASEMLGKKVTMYRSLMLIASSTSAVTDPNMAVAGPGKARATRRVEIMWWLIIALNEILIVLNLGTQGQEHSIWRLGVLINGRSSCTFKPMQTPSVYE